MPEEMLEPMPAADEVANTEAPIAAEAAAEAPAEAPVEVTDKMHDPNMKWYIIHTYSGFEQKVRESLRTRAEAFGFADRLGEVLIPTEEVVEMRNGKKINTKRMLYPGYVLVQMAMDETLWHAVKDTPRVTGFVGGGKDPVPLTADEVNAVLYRQEASAERPRPKLSFEKGETVRITEGPFADFNGTVEEILPDKGKVRVSVSLFGRPTSVELDYLQLKGY